MQDSLSELNNEIQQHPSILPVDFDLTLSGELVITAPQPTYQTEFISSPNPEIDDQRVPVAKLSHSSSGEPNSPQVVVFNSYIFFLIRDFYLCSLHAFSYQPIVYIL